MSRSRIGIDIGALTVKGVRLDAVGSEPRTAYRFHHGDPVPAVRELLQELAGEARTHIALTASAAEILPARDDVARVDGVRATIAAVGRLLPDVRNIIDIGGGGLRLIRLDTGGHFAHFSANSQCAAGTGAFLDEQANRLGLTHQRLAGLRGVDDPPPVATRCAVFAKSDLIHLQQAGASLEQMWSGLCRGMAQTALQTLLRGKPMGGPAALVGGVAQNREVLRWLAELADAPIVTCAHAHVAAALGAALVAGENGNGGRPVDWHDWLRHQSGRTQRPPAAAASIATRREALALRRTKYPSFAVAENVVDAAGNEIRVSRWPATPVVSGTLGIDIGSTSTKLCLVDANGDVLVDLYRKTAGEPIGATQKLFDALQQLSTARGSRLEIRGCGTTGSGRKLVGAVVGADAVINEISAHVAGAMHVDPSVETIFEIGGQDSKYMRTRNGAIAESNMNYVCAAGTGSFVEEQARKLGVPLQEIGDRVLGLVPPQTSDRCTVFMEQDVNDLLRAGHDVDHALAAVMRSVVQNYLNKVVGSRPWSRDKIGFQGATARNKGLVAAFETLLDVEVVVSPYCHVMGAWGVALLTQTELRPASRPTTFRGLELSRHRIELRKERCSLCNNECEITFAHIDGRDDEPSWGYLCGRDPAEDAVRVHHEYDLFRRRRSWLYQEPAAAAVQPARSSRPAAKLETRAHAASASTRVDVHIPRALTFYSHLPYWRRLLRTLGAMVHVAPESSRQTRERGAALVGAEFCFPVKLAHGQVGEALDATGQGLVLVPRMVAQPPVPGQSDTYFCPYVQGFPAVVEAAIVQQGHDAARLLQPTLDLRLPEDLLAEQLHQTLGPVLGVTRKQVRAAHRQAWESQLQFESRCRKAGVEALDALRRGGRRAIVLVGRPYNLMDPATNLDLPRKIAEMGLTVIPIDLLPFAPETLPERYRNIFWAYGQRVLSALQFVRQNGDLFAVYFTNFNCGPDSFLVSYASEIMGDKPMLALELDEHGADAGYITRLEAFLDVVRHWQPRPAPAAPAARLERSATDLRDRRIWIPPMHAPSATLFAAAFRGAGYDAMPLPTETRLDLESGQRLTRGCECLPMRTTIGCFMNTIRTPPEAERKHALFMPTAQGPCRFGQYATLDRLIFERSGMGDVPILSPSGDNGYYGLPSALRRSVWTALLAADTLDKLACRVRPYETTAGDTDATFARGVAAATAALESQRDLRPVLRQIGADFARIPVRPQSKPLVGIVGEIYVRNNSFSNEDLVRHIERAGGEVWSAQIPEWILFTTWQDVHRPGPASRTPRQLVEHAGRRLRLRLMERAKIETWKAAGPVLADREEPHIAATVRAGQRYLPFNVGGETLISLGRAVHFVRQGVSLVVNASPFGCMPGTIAAGIFSRFERDLGVPVLNLFYEGTGGVNRQIDVFLANLNGHGTHSNAPRPNAAARVAASARS